MNATLRIHRGHVMPPRLHLFDEAAIGLTRYQGSLTTYGTAEVLVVDPHGHALELDPPRQGWHWGDGGFGAHLLAQRILIDVLRDTVLATLLCDAFVWAHVAKWGDEWEISAADVAAWAAVARDARDRGDDPEKGGAA